MSVSSPKITPEEQRWFSTWRYVSPQTLKVEMGLSKAMDDMEANFKVGVEGGGRVRAAVVHHTCCELFSHALRTSDSSTTSKAGSSIVLRRHTITKTKKS